MGFLKRHKLKFLSCLALLLLAYWYCLPAQLFNKPVSTVLFDRQKDLLAARIAADGQWRFPHNDSVPPKFKAAIIAYEDKRFEAHYGVDVWAIFRAIRLNIKKGKTVSGGSTLTMQTIRMSRNNPKRTFFEKIKELLLATRIEWAYSKDKILAFYASNAPFGGNVVGLDAAAWKYFARSSKQLSWAESCMLAVLPNSPALIHVSRNRKRLKEKRDWLLDKLCANGQLDSLSCQLAKMESLPDKPKALPRTCPHLLERVHLDIVQKDKSQAVVQSTIDGRLQQEVNDLLDRHYQVLKTNEIYNAAALVVSVETGDVLVYAGNVPSAAVQHSPSVDIIQAARSSGSILKPFLYASMLHDGLMTPETIYPDIPSHFGAYHPKNFDESYSGAVKANKVISKSLNIPSVYMLKQYGISKFADKLRKIGMTTLDQAASHYGLTLVLGGAETSLWDLGAMYAGMARNLSNNYHYNGWYDQANFRPLNFIQAQSKGRLEKKDQQELRKHSFLSASSIWHTFESMQELVRPNEEVFWKHFPSAHRVAWKTGTSFGFRDAWAVGCTPQYVVAVWVGNADGEGRPGLVGVQAAAPVLFDIFNVLNPERIWFDEPYDEEIKVSICDKSGHLASENCEATTVRYVPASCSQSSTCPYHQLVYLSADKKHRVHSDCESPARMQQANYFILPPTQSWYYRKKHPAYQSLPDYRSDCVGQMMQQKKSRLDIVYPQNGMKIFIPTNLDESKSKTVFEAKHSQLNAVLYWHLDNEYVGETKELHHLELQPSKGKHRITIVDEKGTSVHRDFEILELTE